MGLFDILARGLTGEDPNRRSQSRNYSGSYNQVEDESYTQRKVRKIRTFQCQNCGKTIKVEDTPYMSLPNGMCPAAGRDIHGHAIQHIWREI